MSNVFYLLFSFSFWVYWCQSCTDPSHLLSGHPDCLHARGMYDRLTTGLHLGGEGQLLACPPPNTLEICLTYMYELHVP